MKCGTNGIAVPSGEILSPNHPRNYPDNEDCITIISLPAGSAGMITLTFLAFDVEKGSNCRYDYLEVRDGVGSSAQLIGKYCGSTLPAPIIAASGKLGIK